MPCHPLLDDIGQRGDKGGCCVQGEHDIVRVYSGPFCNFAKFDVNLVQRFDMIGNERNRNDQETPDAIAP